VIKSFKGEEAARLFTGEFSAKLPPEIQIVARRKLRMLHRAINLDDVKAPPGNRLEPLKGTRKGSYGIRINDQWRICFVWEEGSASEVEIVDYHKGKRKK
jgi:toxin HigB-1